MPERRAGHDCQREIGKPASPFLAVDVHSVRPANAFAARAAKTETRIDRLQPDQRVEQHALAVVEFDLQSLHPRFGIQVRVIAVDVKREASHGLALHGKAGATAIRVSVWAAEPGPDRGDRLLDANESWSLAVRPQERYANRTASPATPSCLASRHRLAAAEHHARCRAPAGDAGRDSRSGIASFERNSSTTHRKASSMRLPAILRSVTMRSSCHSVGREPTLRPQCQAGRLSCGPQDVRKTLRRAVMIQLCRQGVSQLNRCQRASMHHSALPARSMDAFRRPIRPCRRPVGVAGCPSLAACEGLLAVSSCRSSSRTESRQLAGAACSGRQLLCRSN